MLIPHKHQVKAVDATFEYLANNDGVGIVVAPVAAGKSLIIAETIKRACAMFPDTNCLVLTHVARLLVQDEAHLRGQWPEARTSFYAQKLKKKSFDGQTIFAMINSIYKKAYKIPKRIDIIFIDEGHLVSPDSETMYRKFLKDMLIINPYVRIIGYTGTAFRATDGRLTEGTNPLFTDIIYQIPMLYLVEKGFLCPLVTPPTHTRLSAAGVKVVGGEYANGQIEKAVDHDYLIKPCVDEIVEHGATRNKWLVFTAGIDHCTHVRDEIRSRGISCEMITYKDDGDDERIYEAFKRGDFKCLVNVSKATTGIDIPAIDLIAFMRPIKSGVLYVQCGGRGMRKHPGKINCCLLDFGGVVNELGPIDLVDAKRAMGPAGGGEAPTKKCPQCESSCFAAARECLDCGHVFPPPPLAIVSTASSAAAMSNQIEPEWHAVLSVSYKSHTKAGGTTPTLCATYNTLSGSFREYIGFEYTGGARERAAKWHKRRCVTTHDAQNLPRKVAEALKVIYKEPKRVLTRQSGKYFEILDYEF